MATGAPHIEEQLHNYDAWLEGLKRAKALPPGHLLELYRAQKKESEDAYRDLRQLWAYWWRLWMSEVDFGEKEDWQTQIWIPKPFTSVEQATGLVQRSLLESSDSFGLDGVDDNDKVLAQKLWTPWIQMGFEDAHYIEKFTDGLKVGFIAGVTSYQKFRYRAMAVPQLVGAEMDEQGRLRPRFRAQVRASVAVDNIMPWNIWRDPRSKPRGVGSGGYLIHGEHYSRADVRQMAANGWDTAAIDAMLAKGSSGSSSSNTSDTSSAQAEAARAQHAHAPSPFRQTHFIGEWWGVILDQNGDPVFPDGLMHVGDDNHLLYGPEENPSWAIDPETCKRELPFAAAAPLIHPSRFEGRGLIEQTADLNRLYSGTFCMMADGMNWKVNPEREVWQDALADWNDTGTYPGKTWIKKRMEQAVRAVDNNLDIGGILAYLQFVATQTQNSDFVSDMAIGLPGTRSDITKGEVQIKTGQALAIFEAIGRNYEGSGRRAVRIMRNMLAQYSAAAQFQDPALLHILGPQNAYTLAQLPPAERFNLLIAGSFNYRFTGVTQALEKDKTVGKIVQWGQLAGSMPYVTQLAAQAPQVFMEVLHVLRDILGLADRIHLPEPSQMPMPAGGGMPPGMPGAPGAPGGGMAMPNTPEDLLRAAEAHARGVGQANQGMNAVTA